LYQSGGHLGAEGCGERRRKDSLRRREIYMLH